MVKLFQPLTSASASGTLADAITFQTQHGRHVVRRKPRTPPSRSPMQNASRLMLAFLSSQWAQFSNGEKQTWDIEAASRNVSPFNVYLATNLKRWRSFLYPGTTSPVDEVRAPSTWFISAATADGNTIWWRSFLMNPANDWGAALFRSTTTGFTPTLADCTAIWESRNAALVEWYDRGLAPDTYYYRAKVFSLDGQATAAYSTQVSATVTP